MPLRPVLFLALLLAGLAVSARAQVVEYDIPTEYTLYPDRLAVTFRPGTDSAAAHGALAELNLTVLESDFRVATVHAVLAAPLSESRRAALTAEASVHDVYVQPLALDRYLVVVELVPGTEREPALALLAGFDDLRQEPAWQPARRDVVVAVAPEEQDALSKRLEALPLVDYVSYVAEP